MADKRNHSAKELTPVERMIRTKQKLIRRLESEIVDARMSAEDQVKRIEFRIQQAKTILTALEKGTLKAG